MKFKVIFKVLVTVSALSQMAITTAATVIGRYSLEATATLSSGQGLAYNGTDWFNGLGGNSWQRAVGTSWQTSTPPTAVSDQSASTFLAATSTEGSLSLSFGFTGTNLVNGSGADLAFFFLFDQSANTADVTINGVTKNLSLQNVYNNSGVQQVANGVKWNGTTLNNVLLMVGLVDLNSFGVMAGAAVTDPFSINLTATGTPIALSMVGALHTGTGTVVPLPAPLVLLFSGLAAFGLIGRRK